MELVLAGILITIAGGVFQAFLQEGKKALAVFFFMAAGSALAAFAAIPVMVSGKEVHLAFAGRSFLMDSLSAFFVVIISALAPLAALYSVSYMKPYAGRGRGFTAHYLFLPVLAASMTAVVISSDALSFLFSWEIMAISSFFLVIFEDNKKETLEAGIYYLVMSHISAALLIAGFALASGNGMSFVSISDTMRGTQAHAALVFALLSCGFAVKAGIVPFHTWLPAAHPAAPSHISALMSAVMIKMGIYGFLRALVIMPETAAQSSYFFIAAGLISSFAGILNSMAQRDIKRSLAYSTIENAGIITTAIGFGLLGTASGNALMSSAGFAGALMHVMNHSLIKTALFFGAGTVYHAVHTRDMAHMGGLSGKMPLTSSSFLAGSAAISGLPPFSGFIGKFLIYIAMIEAARSGAGPDGAAGVISLAVFGLVSSMSIISFTRIYGIVFCGMARGREAAEIKSEDKQQAFLAVILAVFCAAAGIFPLLLLRPALYAVSALGIPVMPETFKLLGNISLFFLCFSIVAAALLAVKGILMKGRVKHGRTWACGYSAPDALMQYTAFSFPEPFLEVAGPLCLRREQEVRVESLAGKKGRISVKYSDITEKLLVKPFAGAVTALLKFFSWIQSGNMQRYIIYGLVFLVFSIVWALGTKK